ncbi:MAG: Eco57I restriction-modification methylase domain-containing protein [Bacillota bacterium]
MAVRFPHLMSNLFKNGRFSIILTNPPFGAPLKIANDQAKKAGLSIVDEQNSGQDIELGLAMFNRCCDLLGEGGYLCIVLPETYFFSPSYAFVRSWCKSRLRAVGVVNIPMEAFQGFCRAKTNLYIFQKIGGRRSKNKSNFSKRKVFFLNPKTCGVYKNGGTRYRVDEHGYRTSELDNEFIEAC